MSGIGSSWEYCVIVTLDRSRAVIYAHYHHHQHQTDGRTLARTNHFRLASCHSRECPMDNVTRESRSLCSSPYISVPPLWHLLEKSYFFHSINGFQISLYKLAHIINCQLSEISTFADNIALPPGEYKKCLTQFLRVVRGLLINRVILDLRRTKTQKNTNEDSHQSLIAFFRVMPKTRKKCREKLFLASLSNLADKN